METVYRDTIPDCDICKATDLVVVYDMPYQGSSWANCCEMCRKLADNPNHPAEIRIVKGENPKAKALKSSDVVTEEQRHAENLTMEEIESMVIDSVVETADGCMVEPDGTCPHGYKSPLLVLGMM